MSHAGPEIERLYKSEKVFNEEKIESGNNFLSGFSGDYFDIDADIDVSNADRVGFRIRDIEIVYDVKKKELNSGKNTADLMTSDGCIQLRILVDKTSIEIYANKGEVFMPLAAVPKDGQDKGLELFVDGGTAKVSLAIRELKSVC